MINACAAVLLAACEQAPPPADSAVSDARLAVDSVAASDRLKSPDGPITCLGTKYPGRSVIDPDDPDYQDALWTKDEVKKKFAAAKAQNLASYRAYKAARQHAAVLECAYCACGCVASDGHVSAVDCFIDMHGFG